MSTLSQFPLRRLSLLCRAPFWAQALAVCALFAIAGVAALDDYGVTWDEPYQRQTAKDVADYALGVSEDPPSGHDRYYGVALEMPLLLAERALGLQDNRHIYLMRHLLTHLFFIAGGFAAAMLAYRMLGSRWIALLAMLMFLLHPRLYAHSFFNSKDVPFAVMIVIALYMAHRAFRRDTLGAFLLCGIGVGLAINLRVFGLMLLPMILAMRAPDLWQAGRGERKRILTTGAAFLASALGTAYIIHPYYWENPLRLIEGVRVLSQHPAIAENLFMGKVYLSDAVPWNYIPVWFAITAPPVALLLGALGMAAVCWQGAAHPLRALRNREIRFRVVLLGCFALPVAVAIILQSNIYDGWRQMYFLWGPFCLLAAVGLRALASNTVGNGGWKVTTRLPEWVRGDGLRRALAYGVAGIGLTTTLTAMAALHPHQQVYFNALADTKTPGALAKRYDMDYWVLARRQLMEYLLARYPDDTLRVWRFGYNMLILPQNDRERIANLRLGSHDADFYFYPSDLKHWNVLERPAFYSVQAYGSDIAAIVARDEDAYHDKFSAVYDDVAASGTLLTRSVLDIYVHDGRLYYLNADCAPDDAHIFLHVFAADPADLPIDRREHGFENEDFSLGSSAAFFDGKCIHRQPLPDYPITRIRTGQGVEGNAVWFADIDLAAHAAAQSLYNGIAAGDYGQPAAQSDFDVYLSGDGLAYLKEPCSAGDTDARFFLHIFPADPADLPADSRARGFENADFLFADHGANIGDKCAAMRELPDYPIERIRTGQFVSGYGRLWDAEFSVDRQPSD